MAKQKAALERCIVVADPPTINIIESGISITTPKLTELKRTALFYDKIVTPVHGLGLVSTSAEIDYLKDVGLLTQLPCEGNVGGRDIVKSWYKTAFSVFQDRELKEPGQWCISEWDDSMLLTIDGLAQGRGGVAQLTNAIPLPDIDVPLEDLLNFKLKRMDELKYLTMELDQLYSNLIRAEDVDFELQRICRIIDQRCWDLIKVGRESNLSFKLSDIKLTYSLEFDSGDLIKNSAIGGILGSLVGLPETGALLGATSSISFKAGVGGDIGVRAKTNAANSPFQFVANLHNQPI